MEEQLHRVTYETEREVVKTPSPTVKTIFLDSGLPGSDALVTR